MVLMARVYNFSAGPSMLPESVLRRAAAEMLDYEGSGQSVMEMSHRSKTYDAIIKSCEALLREVMADLSGIRQLAVVGKRDAEGRVDVERLGLCGARGAGGRIADMGYADVALQAVHVADLKNVLHKAVCLSLPELSV